MIDIQALINVCTETAK